MPVAVCLALAAACGAQQVSRYVTLGTGGRLVYTPDARGDRIPDFSSVGYMNGKVSIPYVPVRATVSAGPGDDTARIQDAIDLVSAMPLDANGFRGAVLLKAGRYGVSGRLHINASGVVLRGEGRWDNSATNTILRAKGNSKGSFIIINGGGTATAGPATTIIDKVAPVGINSFRVASTDGFAVGDQIVVTRPSTQAWINANNMNKLDNPWQPGTKDMKMTRTVTRIEGDRIFVHAPLVEAIDQQYGAPGTVEKLTDTRITNVGIENIRGESDYDSSTDESHRWNFVEIDNARDVWVREVKTKYFAYAAVYVGRGSARVTVDDVINHNPKSKLDGGRRYAFPVTGQETLVQNCESKDSRHDYALHSTTPGPNVFYNSKGLDANNPSGPHHRWSAGALYDHITIKGDELNVRNRGNMGTGHGWAGANTVVWNCTAEKFRIYNPPTAQNWAVGNHGSKEGNGNYDLHGQSLEIPSLYQAQLSDATANVVFHLSADGNWSDGGNWDQGTAPRSREIVYRDYLAGDIDGFTHDGTGSADEAYIEAAWQSAVESDIAGDTLVGFDGSAGESVAFTIQRAVDPGEQVLHGTIAMAMRKTGDVSDDYLRFFDMDAANSKTLAELGWDDKLDAGGTFVGVIDFGDMLDLLQGGNVNVMLSNDTAMDWAILSTTVMATPAEANAIVHVGGGRTVTLDSHAADVAELHVAGQMNVATGGQLTVTRGAQVDGGGVLLVAGSLAGDVTVQGGGTFGGGGTVGDLSLAGGVHAPGASAGTDHVEDYWLGEDARLEIELLGLAAGSQHDQVDVTGSVTLGGQLDVILGFGPDTGEKFLIIDNDGDDAIDTLFSGLEEGGLFSEFYDDTEYTFMVFYNHTDALLGADGNDVVLQVVPEPGMALLLLAGVPVLARAGRRRRR